MSLKRAKNHVKRRRSDAYGLCLFLFCNILLGGSALADSDEGAFSFFDETRRLGMLYREVFEECLQTDGGAELSQEGIDTIERFLLDQGVPVLDSDGVYPTYLTHSQGVIAFFEEVQEGKDAQTAYWGVLPSGGLAYTRFLQKGGVSQCTHAISEWTEDGELTVVDWDVRTIRYWALTGDGDLIYQDAPSDRHWDAAQFVRLERVNPEHYDPYLKYIAPIGYADTSFFVTNWSAEDYVGVDFGSLLDGLYSVGTGAPFDAGEYPYLEEPFPYRAIPSALFEETVWSHFDLPLSEFRARAQYDAGTDTYSWRIGTAGDLFYSPSVLGDVLDCVWLEEDTICLVVKVLCPDAHLDCVFVHELTIRLLEAGGFQYLENRVLDAV